MIDIPIQISVHKSVFFLLSKDFDLERSGPCHPLIWPRHMHHTQRNTTREAAHQMLSEFASRAYLIYFMMCHFQATPSPPAYGLKEGKNEWIGPTCRWHNQSKVLNFEFTKLFKRISNIFCIILFFWMNNCRNYYSHTGGAPVGFCQTTVGRRGCKSILKSSFYSQSANAVLLFSVSWQIILANNCLLPEQPTHSA